MRHTDRTLGALPPLLLALALSACGGGDTSRDDGAVPAPSVEVADGDGDAVADVIDVYESYWDVKVAAQDSGELDVDALESVARGAAVENLATLVGDAAEDGILFTGAPDFEDHEAAVSGDTATATVCIDTDDWAPEGVEVEQLGMRPVGAELERVDGAWFVTEELEVAEIGRGCGG